MYYQCPTCECIYATHREAVECCEPEPNIVADELVEPCCQDMGCNLCSGSGFRSKFHAERMARIKAEVDAILKQQEHKCPN